MKDASIDAVIVAYGSIRHLERLIPLLVACDSIGSVVVVDHGIDGSGEVAASLGAIGVHRPENPGFGAGQNLGRTLGSAPLVLVLNPDVELDVGAVEAGRIHLCDPSVGGVQGVIRSASDGKPERSAGDALGPIHLWGRVLGMRRLLVVTGAGLVARALGVEDHVRRVPCEPVEVEALAATATLFRRTALDEVAGFDERLFLYGEDLDLCVRLRATGWRLLALPETWAVHESGSSSVDRWSRELVWWEGTLRFAALHWSGRAWRIGSIAGVLRCLLLAVRRPRETRTVWRRLVVGPRRLRHGAYGLGRVG